MLFIPFISMCLKFHQVQAQFSDPVRSKARVNFFFKSKLHRFSKKNTKINGLQPGHTSFFLPLFFLQPGLISAPDRPARSGRVSKLQMQVRIEVKYNLWRGKKSKKTNPSPTSIFLGNQLNMSHLRNLIFQIKMNMNMTMTIQPSSDFNFIITSIVTSMKLVPQWMYTCKQLPYNAIYSKLCGEVSHISCHYRFTNNPLLHL